MNLILYYEAAKESYLEFFIFKSEKTDNILYAFLVEHYINSYYNLHPQKRVCIIEITQNDKKMYLKERYDKMKDNKIVELKAEKYDDFSDDSLFSISSWGADLSFREICAMYEENELVKPELQRKYVWDRTEASRFIESILMGLPVPSVFFAQSGSQKLIVDGYQRIMTVYDYINGIFSADGKIFRLSNSLKINEKWRNKSFNELSLDDQRKIKSTTIHVIIFEQKKPENNEASLYQIFERINTGGRSLNPQEIRNCIYQGSFNSMLFELNKNEKWRKLFGVKSEDGRMRDLEFILRFFLIKDENVQGSTANQISLKKELNNFMKVHRDDSIDLINIFKNDFNNTIDAIYELLGENAFHNYSKGKYTKKFHPAIYDAIMTGFCKLIKANNLSIENSIEKHKLLLQREDFIEAVSVRTTDVANIKMRINLVVDAFKGE